MSNAQLLRQATDSMKVRDYEAAGPLIHKLLSESPGEPSLHILAGNFFVKTGDVDRAFLAYRRSLKIDPRSPEALNNIGIVYRQRGNIPAAVKAAERAHAIDPSRADICYNLANFHKLAGESRAAEKWYRKAIQIDPRLVYAYNNYGNLHEQQGRHDLAERYYQRGLKDDANNPMLQYNLGVTMEAEGEHEQAAEHYRLALKSRPEWVEGWNNYGVALQKLGRLDESLRAFRRVLQIDRADIKAKNNIGVILTEQGDYREAERYLREALEHDPHYVKASLNLGRVYEESGETEKAETQLKAVVDADPENEDARLQYASVLIQRGLLRDAEFQLKHILKGNPESVRALVLVGNLMLRAGKPDRALPYLKKALSISPSDAEARIMLAQAYRDKGQTEMAIGELSYLLKVQPAHHAARQLLGELFLKNNLYDEALTLFLSLVEEAPDDYDALAATVRTYNAMGDQETAMSYAERLVTLQEDAGTGEDLDNLHNSLQMYEQIVNEYAHDFEEVWERNLDVLAEPLESQLEEDAQEESESLLFGELPEDREETVPIIDIGGIEPVLAVHEEEEVVRLDEREEEIFPPVGEERFASTTPASKTGPTGSPAPGQPDQRRPEGDSEPDRKSVRKVIEEEVVGAEPSAATVRSAASPEAHTVADVEADITPKDPFPTREAIGNLLHYLAHFPVEDDMLLRIETLRRELWDTPGIRGLLHGRNLPLLHEEPASVSDQAMDIAFCYIRHLAAYLPDENVARALRDRVARAVVRIRRMVNG